MQNRLRHVPKGLIEKCIYGFAYKISWEKFPNFANFVGFPHLTHDNSAALRTLHDSAKFWGAIFPQRNFLYILFCKNEPRSKIWQSQGAPYGIKDLN